jgi:hypothetical protein
MKGKNVVRIFGIAYFLSECQEHSLLAVSVMGIGTVWWMKCAVLLPGLDCNIPCTECLVEPHTVNSRNFVRIGISEFSSVLVYVPYFVKAVVGL